MSPGLQPAGSWADAEERQRKHESMRLPEGHDSAELLQKLHAARHSHIMSNHQNGKQKALVWPDPESFIDKEIR